MPTAETHGIESRTRVRTSHVLALAYLPQVLRVAKSLAAGGVPFRSAIVTGEHGWATQRKCADNGLELLVGTPGRIRAHIDAEVPSFALRGLRHVVLDEVDVMYQEIRRDIRRDAPEVLVPLFCWRRPP